MIRTPPQTDGSTCFRCCLRCAKYSQLGLPSHDDPRTPGTQRYVRLAIMDRLGKLAKSNGKHKIRQSASRKRTCHAAIEATEPHTPFFELSQIHPNLPKPEPCIVYEHWILGLFTITNNMSQGTTSQVDVIANDDTLIKVWNMMRTACTHAIAYVFKASLVALRLVVSKKTAHRKKSREWQKHQ